MARLPRGLKRSELDELLELDEQIKALQVRFDVLKDKVARAHGDVVGPRIYGLVLLDFGIQRRFDKSAFEAAHPAEKRPEFYALAVLADAVPKELRGQFVTPVRTLSVRRAA